MKLFNFKFTKLKFSELLLGSLLIILGAPLFAFPDVSGEIYPNHYSAGYYDITINMSNKNTNREEFRPEIKLNGAGSILLDQYVLDPGSRKTIHVPTFAQSYRIDVESASGNREFSLAYTNAEIPAIHLTSQSRQPSITQEQKLYNVWEKEILPLSNRGYYSSSTSTPKTLKGSACYQLYLSEASDDWRSYQIVPVVMIDQADYNTFSLNASGRALLTSVQMGTRLIIFNSSEEKNVYRGLGIIQYTELSPYETPSDFFKVVPTSEWWFGIQKGDLNYLFPELVPDELSIKSPIIIAIVFFLVAGPLNYWYLRKKSRIKLLFITVPIFSGLFCLLIIGVFLGTEGASRRHGAVTYTYFDFRNDLKSTLAMQGYYSGVFPRGGFAWDSQTLFAPIGQATGNYRIDNGTLRLIRGQFQPLVLMKYLTMKPEVSREKLILKSDDLSNMTVANGFENDIEQLYVYIDGDCYEAFNIRSGGMSALTFANIEEVINRKPFNGERIWAESFSHFHRMNLFQQYITIANPGRKGFRLPVDTVPIENEKIFIGRFSDMPKNLSTGIDFNSNLGGFHVFSGRF